MLQKIKKTLLKDKKYFLFFSFVFLLILFVYKDLFLTFYQQDEWVGYGSMLSRPLGGLFDNYSIIQILSGQGRILGKAIYVLLYTLFPFQIFPFAIFSLILHFTNTILVFILAEKISQNKWVAAISSIFFAVAWVGNQAVVWAASASIQVLPSSFLIFLSMILYLKYLETNRQKFFYFSILSLIISLYFKESGLFLFLFFPVMYFMYRKKKSLFSFIKRHWALFIYGLFYVSFNFLGLLATPKKDQALYATKEAGILGKVILHMFLYPITSISQIYFPDTFVYKLTRLVVEIQYPALERVVTGPIYESIVADGIFIFISFCIIIFLLLLSFNKRIGKSIIFVLLFTLLSFSPYILLFRPNSLLESRYFYVGVAGAGILLGLVFIGVKDFLNKKKVPFSKFIGFLFFLIILSYSFMQANITKEIVDYKAEQARQRTKIISQMKKLYPSISNVPIFYITGDHDFMAKGQNLPFQQGIGYTLMVLYYKSEFIPEKFLQERYLWGILDQGYKESGDLGFGYYWDKKELKKEFEKNKKLNINQIVGFYYDAEREKMKDITQDIKNYIRGEEK